MLEDDPNFPKGGLSIKPSFDVFSKDSTVDDWAKDSKEDIVKFGIAGRIWEASYLLQQYLDTHSSRQYDPSPAKILSGGIAIELGAGVGLVGIHLAKQFQELSKNQKSRVILTDLQNVLPLLRRNAERAGVDHNLIQIEPLPWGSISDAQKILNDVRCKQENLSHILCSDLVYFPELLSPLLRTLIQLTSSMNKATILISYKIRSLPKEEPFWRAFGAWFDFQPVLCREKTQPWRLFGSQKADMYAISKDIRDEEKEEIHKSENDEAEDDVFLFVAQRRQETLTCTADVEDEKLLQGFMMKDGQLCQGQGIETFELILLSLLQN